MRLLKDYYGLATNVLHLQHPKSLLLPVYQLLYIITGTCCDCGSIFSHCYDVSGLIVMTFMHKMIVIVINFMKLKNF